MVQTIDIPVLSSETEVDWRATSREEKRPRTKESRGMVDLRCSRPRWPNGDRRAMAKKSPSETREAKCDRVRARRGVSVASSHGWGNMETSSGRLIGEWKGRGPAGVTQRMEGEEVLETRGAVFGLSSVR